MQYIFLLYSNESEAPPPPTDKAGFEAYLAPWKAYTEELAQAGVLRGGEALHLTDRATTVSGPKGSMVTDGPFAETKEQLGGYYVLEVDNLDTALIWAKKCPIVEFGGKVEVRPIDSLAPPE